MAGEEAAAGGDRTEAATQQRLQRAREAGQIPLSREAVTFAALGAATLAFAWSAPSGGSAFLHQAAGLLGQDNDFSITPAEALRRACVIWLEAALPIVLAAAAGGAAAVLLQTGFLLSAAPLRPSLRGSTPPPAYAGSPAATIWPRRCARWRS